MNELIEILRGIGLEVSPQFIVLAVTTVLAIIVAVVIWTLAAVRRSEWMQANTKLYDMLVEFATNAIIYTAFRATEEELAPYKLKEDERAEAGHIFIDYRMLFVLDKLEVWLNQHPGLNIEFDDLLVVAEGIYRRVVHDPSLPDVAPQKVVPPARPNPRKPTV